MKRLFIFLLLGLFLISFTSAITWDNVVYYKLDETSGTVIDAVGYFNGTNFGGTPNVAGKINTAYLFDNNADYIDTNIDTEVNFDSDLTFNVWLNTSATSDLQMILGKFSGSGNNYWFGANPSQLSISINGATTSTSGLSVNNSEWHMATLVVSTTEGIDIYFDGELEAHGDYAASSPVGDLIISGFGTGGADDYHFDGKLDELGVWDRALTPEDVTALFNGGNGLEFGEDYSGSDATITLISPLNATTLSTDGTNFAASFNITGDNPYAYVWKNATTYIWYTNGTFFTSNYTTLSGNNTNGTVFIDDFTLGKNYLWNVLGWYGNATYNNYTWASSNFTFINLPFNESSVSYESSVLETSSKAFSLGINANPQVDSVSAMFFYDGNNYTTSLTNGASGFYNATNIIDIPLQNSIGNKTFYWQFTFTLDDQTTIISNSTIYSNQVNKTFFVLCNSTYQTQFINFTSRSAENPFPIINSTFKSAWSWYIDGGSGTVKRTYTYEDVSSANSTWAFCSSQNVTFITNADIEYNSADYALNFYFLNEAELSNITQVINLYLLNLSKSTVTTLKVVDESNSPIEDVTIQIQFYDIGTGTFYLVGMGKTDFKGEDIAYLNWYDTLYKFILIKDGEIIKSTNTTKISSTPVTFNIIPEETFLYKKFQNFIYSLTFNNATNNFVLTFTKPSGLVDQGCLRVIKRTGKEDIEICFTCESSSSATLYCNLNSAGNGTFIANFYATGSWYDVKWIVKKIGSSFSNDIYELLGSDDASFYAFIFAGIVIFMMFIHPIFAVIGAILGILGASALGFAPIDYGIFMGIVLIGGVIIWIIKR